MNKPVEDGVGNRRFGDIVKPLFDRQLAGDNGRGRSNTIVEEIQ
nr:hypothetical protein [Caulobacter sp. 602-1]